MAVNRPDPAWHFSVLCGRSGFENLRPRWQALIDRLPRSTYLQQPGWIGSYLDTLAGQQETLHFVTASRGGVLGGVLVLSQPTGLRRWLAPELRMVFGEHMVLADLVADAQETTLWPSMLDWLGRQRALGWAVMWLPAVCAGSVLGQALQAPLPQGCQRVPRTHSAWLDCSRDADHALADVSKSFRQNLNRLQRRAHAMGTLGYQVAAQPGELEPALEQLLRVESSGWKKEQGTAIALDPALVAFYHRLVRVFGAQGSCRIYLLTLDDTVIAAQFGLVSDRQLNLLKIGYGQAHASIAPGHLLMPHTIDRVCADPALDRLSFVTHPAWSHLWKPRLTPVESVHLFAPTLTGRLAQAVSGWVQARRLRGAGLDANLVAPAPARNRAPGLVQA